jgi:hypothetical protein
MVLAPLFAASCMPRAAGSRPQAAPIHERPSIARGVTFTVDSSRDRPVPRSDTSATGLFTRFTAVVTVAAGRGRLDVISKSRGPVMSVSGITITAPLAEPGDYYLFDSTGAILVRPRDRTFSSFSFTDHAFNFTENRDGWPEWFALSPIHPEALSGPVPAERLQHGEIRIYWHLDRDQRTPSVRVLARGRLTIDDAPIGEVGIARWFGPSQAMAAMPNLSDILSAGTVGITAVAPVSPPGDNAAPVNFTMQHSISGVQAIEVDLSRLVLPAGFTETRWPGFDAAPSLPRVSPDRGERWRMLPAHL